MLGLMILGLSIPGTKAVLSSYSRSACGDIARRWPALPEGLPRLLRRLAAPCLKPAPAIVPPSLDLFRPGPGAPAPGSAQLVAEAQHLLGRLGFDAGPPDGSAGARTRQAIEAWQRSRYRPVDPIVTANLVAALRREVRRMQPPAGG
ncbi:MAG: peptidoglycan-binding domain-containing protein [Geminicoccaceae bacterium]